MAQLEVAEIVAFIVILICFIFILLTTKADKRWRWLAVGIGFLLLEQIFTNIEVFWWGAGFNFLEHFSAMIGCIIFAAACYISYKKVGGI